MEEVIIVCLNELSEIGETNSRVKCYPARTRARTEPRVTSYSKPGMVVNWDSSSLSNRKPSWLLSALLEVKKQEHLILLLFPSAFNAPHHWNTPKNVAHVRTKCLISLLTPSKAYTFLHVNDALTHQKLSRITKTDLKPQKNTHKKHQKPPPS